MSKGQAIGGDKAGIHRKRATAIQRNHVTRPVQARWPNF